jgi:hypothetical protein
MFSGQHGVYDQREAMSFMSNAMLILISEVMAETYYEARLWVNIRWPPKGCGESWWHQEVALNVFFITNITSEIHNPEMKMAASIIMMLWRRIKALSESTNSGGVRGGDFNLLEVAWREYWLKVTNDSDNPWPKMEA